MGTRSQPVPEIVRLFMSNSCQTRITTSPSLVSWNEQRWLVLALVISFLGSIAVTWPLAMQLSSAIPLGTEREATVPLFNLWTLWWTADRVGHGFTSYWDAPIFYPNPGAFTFSEPQTLTGFSVWPLWASGCPPALAYSCAVLLILTFNGWFTYRLLRTLHVPVYAALFGGLFIVSLPFIAKVLGVLLMLPLFGTMWALEGLASFSQTPRLRHALWASAGYVVQFLTSQQLALLGSPWVGAAGLMVLWMVRYDRHAVLRLVLAALLGGVLIASLAMQILSFHQGLEFERPFALVAALSAQPSDFFTRPGTAILPIPPRESPDRDTAGLFPGILVLPLAGWGFVLTLQREDQRPWGLLFGAMVIGSFVLALGLHVSVGGWHPFWTLKDIVPGFGQLRSPFRFALFTQLGLCFLASIALGRLGESAHASAGTKLGMALGLLVTMENLAIPAPLVEVPVTPRTEWTTWLGVQQDPIVVAHIPFPRGQHVSDYEIEAWRLFAQIDHKKPIINGYSGFFPPGYLRFQLDMARHFPSLPLLCLMSKNLRVTTLVIDRQWLTGQYKSIQFLDQFVRPVFQDETVVLYRLDLPASACDSALTESVVPERS